MQTEAAPTYKTFQSGRPLQRVAWPSLKTNYQKGYHIMTTQTINIKDYIANNLDTGDWGDNFADYDQGYICDIVSEIADFHVDIYYSDLWEWAADNYEWVETAINDGLVDTRSFDIHKAMQCGQFMQIEDDIYSHLADSILCGVLENLSVKELTEDQLYYIVRLDLTGADTLEELIEEAEEIIAA